MPAFNNKENKVKSNFSRIHFGLSHLALKSNEYACF